jgi:hypothetical protein
LDGILGKRTSSEELIFTISSIPDPSSTGGRELCFSENDVVPLLPWRRG